VYLPDRLAWDEFPHVLERIITDHGASELCDVGGGANPAVSLEFLQRNGMLCTILDISREELDKAPAGYRKLQQDIEARDFPLRELFDLVVTRMLAEHMHDGKVFHRNVYALLKPGGIAVHYYPTLYALPFVANKIMPQWLSSMALDVFAPRDRRLLGKFPAYYNWCFGPTPAMLRMLRGTGFEILEFRGLMGNIYYDRIPLIRHLHNALSRFLVSHPSPYLTSFAQVVLRKPEPDDAERRSTSMPEARPAGRPLPAKENA
jgi:SAM-dependent methyltransferase